MKKIIKSMFVIVLLSGAVYLNSYSGFSEGSKVLGAGNRSNVKEVILKVEGMTCRVCPITIKTALKKLDGVSDADVSYRDKEARILYGEGKVTVEEMIKAIENAGQYSVLILQEK